MGRLGLGLVLILAAWRICGSGGGRWYGMGWPECFPTRQPQPKENVGPQLAARRKYIRCALKGADQGWSAGGGLARLWRGLALRSRESSRNGTKRIEHGTS